MSRRKASTSSTDSDYSTSSSQANDSTPTPFFSKDLLHPSLFGGGPRKLAPPADTPSSYEDPSSNIPDPFNSSTLQESNKSLDKNNKDDSIAQVVDFTESAKEYLMEAFRGLQFSLLGNSVIVLTHGVDMITGKAQTTYFRKGTISFDHNFDFRVRFTVKLTNVPGRTYYEGKKVMESRDVKGFLHVKPSLNEEENFYNLDVQLPRDAYNSDPKGNLSGFVNQQTFAALNSSRCKTCILETMINFEKLCIAALKKRILLRTMKIGRRGATMTLRKEEEMKELLRAQEEEERRKKNSDEAWNDMSHWGKEIDEKSALVVGGGGGGGGGKSEKMPGPLTVTASAANPPPDMGRPAGGGGRRTSITVAATRRSSISVGSQKIVNNDTAMVNNPNAGMIALASVVNESEGIIPPPLKVGGGRRRSVALSSKGAGVGIVFGVSDETDRMEASDALIVPPTMQSMQALAGQIKPRLRVLDRNNSSEKSSSTE